MVTEEGFKSNMLLAKAMTKLDGKVIKGIPIMYHDEMQCIFKDFNSLEEWEKEHMVAKIMTTHDVDFGLPVDVDFVDVQPKTVCRITGLACGRKWLYEHDIVEDGDENRWEVVWNKPSARWSLSLGDMLIDISEDSARQLRIVGNTVLDEGVDIE